MGDFLDYFKNKKNLTNLLLLGILVMALPIAVQTMRQQQIINSKASTESIIFTGNNLVTLPGNKLGFKLDPAGKPVVALEISSPIESASQTAQSDNIFMSLVPKGGLVGTVYADTAADCDSRGGLAGEDDVCDTGQGLKVHVYNCNDGSQLPGYVVGECEKVSPTCPNQTCEYTTPDSNCPSGVTKCSGSGANGFNQPGCTFTGGGCSSCTCVPPSAGCKDPDGVNGAWIYNCEPFKNSACPADPKQGIGVPRHCEDGKWVDKREECTTKCTPPSNCPSDQTPVSADVVQKMKNGDYRVDNTIVGEDQQPYKGTGLCGYKYYVYKSTLSNGGGCVTFSFGKWDDQKACPTGQCTVEWTISDKAPAANKSVSVNIKGVKDSGGWQNVDLLLDGSKTGVTGAGMDGGSTPVFKYNVNSGTAGKHTLSFTTSSGKATCTPVGEFTTGGTTGQCPADSALTVTPSTAKVGDEMVFFYPADGKHELNLGDDTWSAGIDASSCKFDLGGHKYTCKAQSATDNGVWNHKWDASNPSGPQCGSATYKITGTPTVTTTHYRIAETPTDFSNTGKYGWQSYTGTPVSTTFEFKDKNPGPKNIFVEFKYSNNKTDRKTAQIRLLSADPTITSCSLSFEANNNTVLNLTGTDFGKEKGVIKSGDNTLTIKEWKDKSIKAVFPNAPEGEKLPVSVSNIDGQLVEGQCSAITQLALGAKVFCRTASAQDTPNVDLALTGDFPGGTKSKQKVTIDKEGNIAGLSQRMEEGKKYKLTLKAPKSVRKTVSFTAVSGGAVNIPNFVLPIGDIMPVPGGDGTINSLDKGELNRQWIIAQSASGRSGDFNGDSRVNSIDWACMRYDFGAKDDPEPAAPLATPIPSASPSVSPSPSPGASASSSPNPSASPSMNPSPSP